MRISVDIGGTFTDMVIERDGRTALYKSPTVNHDPAQGILDVLDVAAAAMDSTSRGLLAEADLFMHATTRGLNAVLTGTAARTAFLTTEGHPDVLVLREGGRNDPFDHTVEYPAPYVPRALTFQVGGRITAAGEELEPVDPVALRATCREIAAAGVEAVGVCLLWSTVNPAHELAVGAVLAEELPRVPMTLSHQLNPSLREFRRASSTCIDASLKPIMTDYVDGLAQRLADDGFTGRFFMVTSVGGVLDAAEIAAAPIHSINSGPSMAPVAGRHHAETEAGSEAVIVADAGGTTYDVTLVRRGHIPWTRAAWIGGERTGHMTGLPSIDVKSVGAGGGSIAWIDGGGLLHVGPQSAGADPGPVCYGLGGVDATVTDAALVLGYLDPATFSAGRMPLDPTAASAAVERAVAQPLGLDVADAAEAIIELTTEQMVRAIEEIALEQGIDPQSAVLVGGGGAAGLNAVSVAQRLGSPQLLIPEVGAALSAAGALMSDLLGFYSLTLPTTSARFDYDAVNHALASLDEQARDFVARAGRPADEARIEFYAEAHYPQQIWELEVTLPKPRFGGPADVETLVDAFHRTHEEVLGITDPESGIEIVGWGARVRCPLGGGDDRRSADVVAAAAEPGSRPVHFPGSGYVDTRVLPISSIATDASIEGPVLVESACTTVVVPAGATCRRGSEGSLCVFLTGTQVPA